MAQNVTIKETSYPLTNGPARAELFNATQYAYDANKQFMVEFTTENGKTFKFRPISVGHEDGSGTSFNICGYIRGCGLSLAHHNGNLCTIYYNSKSRKGVLAIPESTRELKTHGEDQQVIGA